MTSEVVLDTHTLVWALLYPDRLTGRARDAIATADRVAISAASLYELAFKASLGRWREAEPLLPHLPGGVVEAEMEILAVSDEVALRAARLDWAHGDPFDRIIVASALARGAAVVTRDRPIRRYEGVATVW